MVRFMVPPDTLLLSTAPSGMAVHPEHAWLGVWTEHTQPSPRPRQPEAGRKVAPDGKITPAAVHVGDVKVLHPIGGTASKRIRSPARSSPVPLGHVRHRVQGLAGYLRPLRARGQPAPRGDLRYFEATNTETGELRFGMDAVGPGKLFRAKKAQSSKFK